MKVIDARSGLVMKSGDVIHYNPDEYVALVDVAPGLLSASARLKRRYRSPLPRIQDLPLEHPLNQEYRYVEDTIDQPLQVRWTHPKYFLQHVAFIPS